MRTLGVHALVVHLLISGWLAFVPMRVLAQDPGPRFGPEFTFTQIENWDQFDYRSVLAQIRERMLKHLVLGQVLGAKFAVDGNTFRSPNGWWFMLTTDPKVIEVKMSPMTVEEFAHFQDDIQDAVFVSHNLENLYPALYLGGGHINIEVAYFYKKPLKLLRDFVVDLLNNEEIFMGPLGYNTNSALPYRLAPYTFEELAQVIRQFDRGELGSVDQTSEAGAIDFLKRLASAASRGHDSFVREWRDKLSRSHHYTISFESMREINERQRLELRAVRPQSSMGTWVRQIRLFRDRIRYLEANLHRPLPLEPKFVLSPNTPIKNFILNPPGSPEGYLRAFYQFVTESGHLWEDHREYLWPAWVFKSLDAPHLPTALERFERSRWFLEREAWLRTHSVKSCRRMLLGP